jgi:hypothetical protein
MKELYETILARLTAQVPEIKMTDFEMGQIDVLALDQKPALVFPCALIDISFPNCDDEGAGLQVVTARATVKLVFECPLPTDSRATEARRSAALTIFETVDKVYQNMQGYGTDEFSPFSRKAQTPDNRYAGIKIINMIFGTVFEDRTAYQE